MWKSTFLHAEVRVIFGHVRLQKLVTELVSRHLVVTCYRVVSDLLPTCKPRFRPKTHCNCLCHRHLRADLRFSKLDVVGSNPIARFFVSLYDLEACGLTEFRYTPPKYRVVAVFVVERGEIQRMPAIESPLPGWKRGWRSTSNDLFRGKLEVVRRDPGIRFAERSQVCAAGSRQASDGDPLTGAGALPGISGGGCRVP